MAQYSRNDNGRSFRAPWRVRLNNEQIQAAILEGVMRRKVVVTPEVKEMIERAIRPNKKKK